jgi:hypothetical protein
MNARTTGFAALLSLTIAATTASISLQAAPGSLDISTDAFSNSTELTAERGSENDALAIAKSEDRPGLYRGTSATKATTLDGERFADASVW